MSLINCPDCNHQISVHAESCPSCGRPIKKMVESAVAQHIKRRERVIALRILIPLISFIGFVVVGAVLTSHGTVAPSSAARGGNITQQAASTNDQVFADAALRELHDLARSVARYDQATKDSDEIGCRDAHETIQKAAHNALMNMHNMSFDPTDAIGDVSSLLRLSDLATPNGCADKFVTKLNLLFIRAGQAIMSLRWNYAIGDKQWYMIKGRGDTRPRTHSATPNHSRIRTTLGSLSGPREWSP
jgi:hypothetical protein